MSQQKIHITKIDFPYSTSHELFRHVEAQAWSILLDTSNNRLSDGRYDIIVHSPTFTYEFWATTGSGKSKVTTYNEHHSLPNVSTQTCPYTALSILQKAFDAKVIKDISDENDTLSNLPFKLGAMGLFGYDVNTATDKIKDNSPTQYALPDIAVGFYEQSLIFDNYTGNIYHCSAVSNTDAWLAPFFRRFPKTPTSFQLMSPWSSNMSEKSYCAKLAEIDNYLRAGDCYQINFAQRFNASYYGSEWEAYQLLSSKNKAPFSAFIRLKNAAVLSVSPERFLKIKNRHVETKPIKGTRKRDDDPNVDQALASELQASEKDRAENLMIVDLLRNDLSKHCKPFSVQVPSLFSLESYPAVHHLVTTVIGELKDEASPFDLLKGAFPGGSITGAPKVRAMQIIQALEPDKRSIYCGSIGYVGIHGDMDTNICIRTVLAETATDGSKQMYCWAGGGIVLDSKADAEYQETFDKVARILPVFEQTLGNHTSKKSTNKSGLS